jgi:hypothetical protein
MATRNIVYWECQAIEHRALHSRHANGGLTINEGKWAYCDGAGADDKHRWVPTGGLPLESLVRWTAPNGSGHEATFTVTEEPSGAKASRQATATPKPSGANSSR